jgi:DNA-binding transcriptional LysR family regulator
MLDLKQLRVLTEVARAGSMTRAAATLSYTPSAVSQQIAVLERRIGAPLLVRHARGVRLTEAGRMLVDRVARIDDQLELLERDVDDLVQLRSGRLRLASFASASSRLIPAAITRFRECYPEVMLSLDILDPEAAVDRVAAGAVDLAVIFDYPGEVEVDTRDLVRHPLPDDEIYLALPGDHRLAQQRSITIDALRSDQWIRDSGPDPICRELLDRLCSAAGFRPQVAFEGDNYLTIGRLVEAGVGVTMVPRLGVDHFPPGLAVLPLEPRVARRVTAIPAAGAGPAAAEMIKILSAVAEQAVQGNPGDGATAYPATRAVRR